MDPCLAPPGNYSSSSGTMSISPIVGALRIGVPLRVSFNTLIQTVASRRTKIPSFLSSQKNCSRSHASRMATGGILDLSDTLCQWLLCFWMFFQWMKAIIGQRKDTLSQESGVFRTSQSIQVSCDNLILNKHRNGSSHTVQQAFFGPEARAAGNFSCWFPKVSDSQFPKSRVFIIIFAEVWRTQDEDSIQDHLIQKLFQSCLRMPKFVSHWVNCIEEAVRNLPGPKRWVG